MAQHQTQGSGYRAVGNRRDVSGREADRLGRELTNIDVPMIESLDCGEPQCLAGMPIRRTDGNDQIESTSFAKRSPRASGR